MSELRPRGFLRRVSLVVPKLCSTEPQRPPSGAGWCRVPPLGPLGRRGLPHALLSSRFSFVAAPVPPSRFVWPPTCPSPPPPLFCPPVVVVPPSCPLRLFLACPGSASGRNRQWPSQWLEPCLGSSWDGGAEARAGLLRQVSAGGLHPRRVVPEHSGWRRTSCTRGWAGLGSVGVDGGAVQGHAWQLCLSVIPPTLVPCCPGCLTEQSDWAWPVLLGLCPTTEPPRGLDGARAGTGRAQGCCLRTARALSRTQLCSEERGSLWSPSRQWKVGAPPHCTLLS